MDRKGIATRKIRKGDTFCYKGVEHTAALDAECPSVALVNRSGDSIIGEYVVFDENGDMYAESDFNY